MRDISQVWIGQLINIPFSFKRSTRTLIYPDNWHTHENIPVYLLFFTIFYGFSHNFVNSGPINIFLGTLKGEFTRLQNNVPDEASLPQLVLLRPQYLKTKRMDCNLGPDLCKVFLLVIPKFNIVIEARSNWSTNIPTRACCSIESEWERGTRCSIKTRSRRNVECHLRLMWKQNSMLEN